MRDLFEDAVKGFYEVHLGPAGYQFGSRRERWPAQGNPDDLAFLPSLNVDVVMRSATRQVIVECKFGRVFDGGYRGGPKLKASYVRQMHSYCTVFSREVSQPTEGLLLAALVDGSPARPELCPRRLPCAGTGDRSVSSAQRDPYSAIGGHAIELLADMQ